MECIHQPDLSTCHRISSLLDRPTTTTSSSQQTQDICRSLSNCSMYLGHPCWGIIVSKRRVGMYSCLLLFPSISISSHSAIKSLEALDFKWNASTNLICQRTIEVQNIFPSGQIYHHCLYCLFVWSLDKLRIFADPLVTVLCTSDIHTSGTIATVPQFWQMLKTAYVRKRSELPFLVLCTLNVTLSHVV